MNEDLKKLATELEADADTLKRELDEIELLLQQATSETERYETRRVQAEEHLSAAELDSKSTPEVLAEARTQLINQTRRQALMQSQLDVLGGKQRALLRYRERVAAALPVVQAAAGAAPAACATHATNGADSGVAMAAQEEMRRDIARQMHDGPAQSIANIALQAQIVQRLFERDPERAAQELNELVEMVQHALEATKSFIFDVRPMVLDDLGLVPTLRRSATEWTRRSTVPVRFESVGTDRRLGREKESGLFRIVDEAVAGMVKAEPTQVTVRLDWSDQAVRARISGVSQAATESAQQKAHATVVAARRDKVLPQQLTSLIHQQEEDDAARHTGVAVAVLEDIKQRAAAMGMTLTVSNDRWQLELVA